MLLLKFISQKNTELLLYFNQISHLDGLNNLGSCAETNFLKLMSSW